MSPLQVFSLIVMSVFAVWAAFVLIRWTPERGVDNNWYESGLGRNGVGGGRGYTN